MQWKKIITGLLAILIVATIVLAVLANRDITRIYGGLTEQVNAGQFSGQKGPFVISNVNVLAEDGTSFIAGQSVVIENNLIRSIASSSTDSSEIHAINGAGKYLIPGLTDAHVHLLRSPNDLLLYVANGVTQVRELIGNEDHLIWRQEISEGRLGPEMFVASRRIGSFGFIEGLFMSWSQYFLNLSTAAEGEKAVKKLHQQGYDAVKIYSQINKETYQAVAETANALGMKVIGHIPWSVKISDLYSNQQAIAHLEEIMNAMNREFGDYGYDDTDEFLAFVLNRSDEIANDLRDNDIVVTTTLWLVESFIRQKVELDKVLKEVELEYQNPGISEWSPTAGRGLGWLPDVNRYKWPDDITEARKANSRKYWETYAKACQLVLQSLVKNGVKIMAGTDASLPPTVPGFSLHDELISLNKAGMSPSQVLMAATATPAQWLNNNTGVIAPGRKANLVLLDKNPLTDISNTRVINSVILNGQLLDRALLDEILASVKQANDASRTKDISRYLN